MNKRCGKCKRSFDSIGVNDNWCTECCKAIPKDKWDEMERKNAHSVDFIQENSEQEVVMLRERCRLLKKALTRIVAEFDTTTPVIPNQKKAVRFANNLLHSNDE